MAAQNLVFVLIPGLTGSTLLDPAPGHPAAWGPQNSEFNQDMEHNDPTAAEQLLEGKLDVGTAGGWYPADDPPPLLQLSGYGEFEHFFTTNYDFQPFSVKSADDVPTTFTTSRILLGFGYDWRADNLARIIHQTRA